MEDKVIALCGNPNVGKSTVFNALTGLNQHTGNWAGKTVVNAAGQFKHKHTTYTVVDLPGCYSLFSHAAEEKCACDFICGGNADAVVVICDASAPERSLALVLELLKITSDVVVCFNLMDEAEKKKIIIDFNLLSKRLNVPVTGITARTGEGLDVLTEAISLAANTSSTPADSLSEKRQPHGNANTEEIIHTAEQLCKDTVTFGDYDYDDFTNYINKDYKIDKILTGKLTAFPIMLIALTAIFWITITGANYPSEFLGNILFKAEDGLIAFFKWVRLPKPVYEMLVYGVYRVLAWVVSVMLPPMAIFFPLFTLLEDAGILPRIAFNLDKCFKKCHACGKQALTMCMGFGCNAAGIVGCRIIDSPRERLIAVITNNFVPCNGRFPALISIISMFFISGTTAGGTVLSAVILTSVIIFGILMTFVVSAFLSKTLLKGVSSSFILELPPYRRPQIKKVIIRSVFDKTLYVLGRAICVAAPAGLIIWLTANTTIGGNTLLVHCSEFLNPIASCIGLDGVILFAFILGFPANEIVVPIIIMAYMANGSLSEFDSLAELKTLLVNNGWTQKTAISFMLFSLMHWPCSTTCLTIKKETKSLKWTVVSIIIPTITGFLICCIFNLLTSYPIHR